LVNVLICVLLLIQAVLLAMLVFRFRKEEDSNLIIIEQVLMNIIDYYHQFILLPKLEHLKAQYDLDPKSRTQAIEAYMKIYNDYLADAAKEIMKKYLSDRCLKVLLKYYSVDGLILYIISNLKR